MSTQLTQSERQFDLDNKGPQLALVDLNRQDVVWAVRRLPKQVAELMSTLPDEAIIAGGYLRSIVANTPVNDIDIFAPSKEKALLWAEALKGKTDGRLWQTDNAYTVKFRGAPAVQFIHRWTFNTPEECISSFDFSIATACIYMTRKHSTDPNAKAVWGGVCSDLFYGDLAAKRLTYLVPVRNEDAGGSLLRVLKFYQDGFRIPLDSMGAVIARLLTGVRKASYAMCSEAQMAKILTGLLYEVDPNAVMDRIPYMPSRDAIETDEAEANVDDVM